MAEIRNGEGRTAHTTDGTTYVEAPRSNTGLIIGGILLVIALIVGVLFLTGFWSMDVQGGALPKVTVDAKGGALPDVDVHSKQLVVGTSKATIDVPKVETKKATVDVPTIGVKDDGKK